MKVLHDIARWLLSQGLLEKEKLESPIRPEWLGHDKFTDEETESHSTNSSDKGC